jgi:hypothetical protein
MSPDNIDLDAQTRENDEKAKIARLATLNPLQYDRQRAGAAEELGVTVSALDKAVKEARSASADTKAKARHSNCRPSSRGRLRLMVPIY